MPVPRGGVAGDRGAAPGPALRPGDPLTVQRLRDRLGRPAGARTPGRSAARPRPRPARSGAAALGQAVRARAGHHVIAVAAAAARTPLLDPAAQATVGLRARSLQEQRVHGALEADMQLADLALGHRHQPHAGEGQLLEQAGGVLLVAAQPVQRLGDHHLEPTAANVLEQPLVARPQGRGAAQGMVGIDLDHRPALPLGQLAAQPHLVLDRGLALRVRAVACVDRQPHHRLRRWRFPCSMTSW